MSFVGAGESIDEPEEIVNAGVGANGSGTDRALEVGVSGGGDHRVTGLEAAGVPPSSAAAMISSRLRLASARGERPAGSARARREFNCGSAAPYVAYGRQHDSHTSFPVVLPGQTAF